MSKIYIGQDIITNKKFIGGEGHKGVIMNHIGDSYGILFANAKELDKLLQKIKVKDDEPQPQLHFLSGAIKSKSGYYLNEEEFTAKPVFKDKDKNKEEFVNSLREQRFFHHLRIPETIRAKRRSCRNYNQDIEYKKQDIKKIQKQILDARKEISRLEKQQQKDIYIDDIIFDYDKLKKNKKIKDIKIAERKENYNTTYFIIRTETLHYTHKDDTVDPFELGAYILYIPVDFNDNIYAANYTKQYMRGSYHHPCIDSSGSICFGGEIARNIKELKEQKDLIGIVFTLLHFLERPNYGEPYLEAKYFQFAQPASIHPRDPFKYLDQSYWRNNEIWDNDLHHMQIAEIDNE